MKKLFAVAVLFAAAVMFSVSFAAPLSAAGSEHVVKLTVPAYGNELYEVALAPSNVESGSGTADDPYVVKNANQEMVVSAVGAGTITIRDENGNVLVTYTKLTNDQEDISIPITVPNSVGIHQITVTFTDLDNPNDVFGTATIFINWRAVPIGPEVPNTGYFYIGGAAIAISAVVFDLTCLVVISGVVIFAIYRRRKTVKPKE